MRAVSRFVIICFLYSWSIFFVVDGWLIPKFLKQEQIAASSLIMLFGHILAMAGPTLSALVMWRFYHKQPLPDWKWGHLSYYILGALMMLALWTVPALLGLVFFKNKFHLRTPVELYVWIMISVNFSLGWLAGLGEELGWIGYLVPYLTPRLGKTRALVVSGVIRGIWHWPVAISPFIVQMIAGERTFWSVMILSLVHLFQLSVSNTVFGSFYGWVWYNTKSLPLLGWLHQWFDAARDTTKLLIAGYADSLWAKRLWGIPFYMLASSLLLKIAQNENAKPWTFAPSER